MMLPPNNPEVRHIYERLGELIRAPKSFGLGEPLSARAFAVLTSTREYLLEQMNSEARMHPIDDDLAGELSQDAHMRHSLAQSEGVPFNALLCRQMAQLHLTPHDVAVSLGTTLQYVWDLRDGAKTPNEQRIAELALLLGVAREVFRTAVENQTAAIPTMA
jgi:hypothetical protein